MPAGGGATVWHAFKSRLWTFIPLLALYALVLAIPNVNAGLQPALSGVPTRATITTVTRCQHDDGTPDGTVKLTLTLRDQRGAAHTYRETACHPYRFGVGRSLTVRYLAYDPSRVATQNDLDHLPSAIFLLVFLALLAALCAGALLCAAIYYAFIAGRPAPPPAFALWSMLPAMWLVIVAAVGVGLCAVLWFDLSFVPDYQLENDAATATATAQVIRVIGCEMSGGDAVIGLLPHVSESHALQPRAARQPDGEQPVISFVDSAGLVQQLELDECDPSYHVGQRLTVTYLLADPTHLTYDGATGSPGIMVFFAALVYTGEALGALALFGWLARAGIRRINAFVARRQDAVYIRRTRRLRQRRAAAGR